MKELLHELLVLLTSSPYLYLFATLLVVAFVVVTLLILFRKRVMRLIKQFLLRYKTGYKMQLEKRKIITLESEEKRPNDIKNTIIQHTEMEDSEIESISGRVTIDNVKMKNSHIGDIRSD